MGDESQADYERYIQTLSKPKADVVWLRGCRFCEATGKVDLEYFHTDTPSVRQVRSAPCGCVQHFICPQCGHKHGRPFFAAVGDVLRNCYVCGWKERT